MSFIIIIFILFLFAYILFKLFSKVNLELPEITLKIAGKIFTENKNLFEHEVIVTLYQEELITLVGNQNDGRVKVFKNAVICLEKETNKIAVYIDTLRVGYLNKINSSSFVNFLKIKGFSETDAFEVDAVIMSEESNQWSVKLDIPYDMEKFRFDKY
ncbi:hypothetical protein AV645_03025 [Acinetobacter calcoaceticus]|uniref:Uncharacterized protein n=1 Tax=Acinetobacter oleivorans TaxID=1148157 RepID=A0A0B2UC84_9GAMM|nr:hypothetical protein [Acinetobacter calcoaceticus]KHN66819.1 hypothetical protein DH17_16845 [Acinetobacter oleivorans]KUM12130.1 hypothetical protein AV645_03025 [Acinetobacter calcoaceticus]